MASISGFDIVTIAPGAPDFTHNTYAQLVTDTLADTATDGDALDVSRAALDALMQSYETDVSAGLAAEDIPNEGGTPFDVGATDAMIAALATADAEETAINGAQDFLENNFGVWNVIPAIVDFIVFVGQFILQVVADVINFILNLLGFLFSGFQGFGGF